MGLVAQNGKPGWCNYKTILDFAVFIYLLCFAIDGVLLMHDLMTLLFSFNCYERQTDGVGVGEMQATPFLHSHIFYLFPR